MEKKTPVTARLTAAQTRIHPLSLNIKVKLRDSFPEFL